MMLLASWSVHHFRFGFPHSAPDPRRTLDSLIEEAAQNLGSSCYSVSLGPGLPSDELTSEWACTDVLKGDKVVPRAYFVGCDR